MRVGCAEVQALLTTVTRLTRHFHSGLFDVIFTFVTNIFYPYPPQILNQSKASDLL